VKRPLVSVFMLMWCIFLGNAQTSVADDRYSNVRDASNVSIGNCAYIWGWYDPDSANYIVFSGLWNSPPSNGISVVKATDPFNPVNVGRISALDYPQDVKVVGRTLYAIEWDRIAYFWIIPLQSEWPYYDAASMRSLPFNDSSIDTVGACDAIPLNQVHTFFAADGLLALAELYPGADSFEVAILDIATNPEAPILKKLWRKSTFGSEFKPHSVFCRGDTIYIFSWRDGIYKGIFSFSTPLDSIALQGKVSYDPYRDDLNDEDPYDSIAVDCIDPDTFLVRPKFPLSHSGWMSPDGNYLFACDEAENACAAWGRLMGGFLRVFDDGSFDFDFASEPIVNAFDVIWDYNSDQDEVFIGIDAIADQGETHCPAVFSDTCFTHSNDAEPLGIHDAIVRGNLLFSSWHYRGIRVTDISSTPDMAEFGFADHDCGSNDHWTSEAYSIYPLSPDGFIYQAGEDGLYIYQIGYTGELTENTTWRGDVYVYETLEVPSGITLRINAGTNIYLYKDAQIAVAGKLVASGTSSDSIRFIALGGNPQPGDWRDIYVDQNAACSLSYCSITNATTGVEARNYSDVFISHSNISHNLNTGVYAYKADLITNNSRITDNGVYGIYGLYSSAKVNASRFVDNDDYDIYLSGGAVSGDSTLLLYDTLINATIFFTRGIYLSGIDKARVNKCVVAKHRQTAITLSNSDAPIDSCSILCGLDANNAIGIYLDNYSTPQIRHCLIDSMFIGVRTLNAEPDMGTLNDPGYSSIRYNPQLPKSYYIYHVKSAPWWDTLYAVYNYYFTGLPSASRFYSEYAWIPIKYWPWLMRQPKLDITPELPLAFAAQQNYPNPFNSNTVISFALDQAGYTRIAIYNILGQRVVTLAAEDMEAGEHTIVWTGRNDSGEPVSSGIYFYVIESGDRFETKKMTLLR